MRKWAAGLLLGALAMGVTQDALAALEVRFDSRTGAWTELLADGQNVIRGPGADVEVFWNGQSLPDVSTWRLESIRTRGGRTSITRRAGDWEIRTDTWVSRNRLLRKAEFRWLGSSVAEVNDTLLRVPNIWLSKSAKDYYLIPDNFPVLRHDYASLSPGQTYSGHFWTRGDYGIACIRSEQARLALIAGFSFTLDDARVRVEEGDGCVSFSHRFFTAARLEHGQSVSTGVQVLDAVRGGEAECRGALSRFAGSIGNGPAAGRPKTLAKCVLYEAHPAGRLEIWKTQDSGFRFPRLTGLVPYYQRLGVTSLWLLPVSWPPPWVYTLTEFNRVAPEDGTPDELRALVSELHAHGMTALADLVVYGINPDSEEVAKLPDDVWCVDENGQRRRAWGGAVLAADCSNPHWQKKIAEVCHKWAADYGFDGARLDCIGWGQLPNWRNPLQPNAPLTFGGLQLNRVVRDSFRAVRPDAFLLPEGGRPLVFRNADQVFDYPLYMAFRDLTVTPDVGLWVSRVSDWLELERCCYPEKALPGLVRFMELHDTVCPAQYFGVGPSQALMAICCLMQGTPLIYQEQETGFTEDLSAWLKLRNSEKCFYDGSAYYGAVRCSDPRVLCFLRKGGDGAAVVAVNLTSGEIRCRLSWPENATRRFDCCADALTAETITTTRASAEVKVPAWRPKILLFKRPSARRQALLHGVAAPPASLPEPDADGAVTVVNPARWYVETPEGRLEDEFQTYGADGRRSDGTPDWLPVLQRAWDPLGTGRLDGTACPDGTGRAAIGAVDKAGKEFRIEFNPSQASQAQMLRPGWPDGPVKLMVRPRSCWLQKGKEGDTQTSVPGISTDALFARLKAGGVCLTLARRHGGLPVELRPADGGASVIGPGADAYTDHGVFASGAYSSVDGETNPRMQTRESAEGPEVTFRGILRERSWNGVQTCGITAPSTPYRMTWGLDEKTGRMLLALGVTPPENRPAGAQFLALHIPLQGVRAWRCADQSGKGPLTGDERVAVTQKTGAQLEIRLSTGTLTVTNRSLASMFLLKGENGATELFFAVRDGDGPALRAGEEVRGEAEILFRPSAQGR